MANLFQPSLQRVLTNDGEVADAARLYLYDAETLQPALYYLNAQGTTPGPSPLVANVFGLFAPVYLDKDTAYRVVCYDKTDSFILYTADFLTGADQTQSAENASVSAVQAAASATLAVNAATEADIARDQVVAANTYRSTLARGTLASLSALLPGVPAYPQGTSGAVYADPSPALNGLYSLTGSSFVKMGDLPETAAATSAAASAASALVSESFSQEAQEAVVEAGIVISTGLAHLEINNNPVIYSPKDVSLRSTAGRLAKSSAGFYEIAEGDSRVVRNSDGTLAGLYFEGEEHIRGANWHQPNTSALDLNRMSSTSNAGVFRYAGTHTAPDLFGTTGKCIQYEKTTTAGTMNLFPTNKRTALLNGDIFRCLVTFVHEPFVGTAYTLRFQPAQPAAAGGFGQSITCTVNPDGSISNVVVAGTIPGRPIIGSIDLVATLPGGLRVYTAWIDGRATGNWAQANPQISLTTTQTGLKFDIHAISYVVNPVLQKPSALPVFQDKLFAADTIRVGGSEAAPFEVEFADLAVGRTKAFGSDLTAPTFYSSCSIPLETKVTIRESCQSENLAFILPSIHWETGARSFGAGTTNDVVLGPGRFEFLLGLNSFPSPAGQMVQYSVRGAYEEPHRWPLVTGLIAAEAATDRVYANRVVAHGPASVGTTVNELSQSSELWRISTRSFEMDNCRIRGHNLWHSRSFVDAVNSPAVDGERGLAQYFGTFNITASLPTNLSHTIKNTEISHLLNGPSWGLRTPGTNVGTVVYDRNYSHDIVVDHYNTGGGSVNHTISNSIMAVSTNYGATTYQSEREIEVDVGAGRVPFSTSGLTLASLKRLQTYEHFGFRATSTADITPKPNRNLSMIPTAFVVPAFPGVFSKPNFEFSTATPFDKENLGAQKHTDLQVYCNVGDGSAPSSSNPHVFLTVQLGRWDAGGYTPGANPVLDSVRLHTDCIQINGETAIGGNLTMLVDNCLLISPGQTMLFGGTSSGPTAVKLFDVKVKDTIAISGGWDAAAIYALDTVNPTEFTRLSLFPTQQPYVGNTFGWIRARGETTDIVLDSCVVTVNNVVGSPSYTSVSPILGGTITGTPFMVGADWRDSQGVVTSSLGRDIPQLRDFIDEKHLDALGHVKVTEGAELELSFSPYAHAITGIAYNSILAKARSGGWTKFGRLNELLNKFDRKPDYFLSVPRATAVGTVVLSNLGGNNFDKLYGGDTGGFFTLKNGTLTVASALTRALPGSGRVFLFVTDEDEHILVDIT